MVRQCSSDYDPWEVLGVNRTATRSEVKSAYHRLVRLYHPDLHPDGSGSAELLERVVNAAERVLTLAMQDDGSDTTASEAEAPAAAPGRRKPKSRYQRVREAQARAAAEFAAANALLYEGRGRFQGISVPHYRITMSQIVVRFGVSRPARLKGASGEQCTRYRDVRRVVGRVELQGKRSDLELELIRGTTLELQSLPDDVADNIERLVQVARERAQKQRERSLRSYPVRR